jgi:hypothetical protein
MRWDFFHGQEWNIARLTFEFDSEPYAKTRDAQICRLASEVRTPTHPWDGSGM